MSLLWTDEQSRARERAALENGDRILARQIRQTRALKLALAKGEAELLGELKGHVAVRWPAMNHGGLIVFPPVGAAVDPDVSGRLLSGRYSIRHVRSRKLGSSFEVRVPVRWVPSDRLRDAPSHPPRETA